MTSSQPSSGSALDAALRRNSRYLPDPPAGPIPLTPSQQGFWFSTLLNPNSSSGNRPVGIRIVGTVDIERLDGAINAVIARHDALHSVVTDIAGVPNSVTQPDATISLATEHVSDAVPDAMREARRQSMDFIQRPFNLTGELPIRAKLFSVDDEEHLLVIVVHHVAFDGWSEQIFISELRDTYGDTGSERPSPTGFRPYAWWHAKNADHLKENEDLIFWRAELADLPLEFGLHRDPDQEPAPVLGPVSVNVGPATSAHIRRLSRDMQVTPFSVLLAGLDATLARYTGEPDQIVSVVSAGRDHPDIERTIGCFVKTVPIRVNADDSKTFADLVNDAYTAVLNGLSHTGVPFGHLVSEVQPQVRHTRSFPFPVMFQMRNFPMAPAQSAGSVTMESVRFHQSPGDAELSVRATDTGGTYEIDIDYHGDRYSTAMIEQLAVSYLLLLEAATNDPTLHTAELPISSESRIDEELRILNDSPWDHVDEPVLRLVERQVEATPDAIAYVEGEVETTYRELDELASTVAARLVDIGAGPNRVIALYLGNSRAFVIGMLAVMKSGAGFVSLDATDTARWFDVIVDDCEPLAILSASPWTDEIPPTQIPVIDIGEVTADTTRSVPDIDIRLDDLGYVMYTSGSTGTPKGSWHVNRSLAAYAQCGDLWEFRPGDRVAQMHVISFDPALCATLLPLAAGSTLVARDEAARGTVARFFAWCDATDITHLLIPRSYYQFLEEAATAEHLNLPRKLRMISAGGEQARRENTQRWNAAYGSAVVHLNTYGPSEVIQSSYKRLDDLDPLPERLPIGQPHERSTMYVLDDLLRPVPIGVLGEIYIGGPQVARGYLKRPENTTRSFLDDPFCDHPDALIYRSGDLGRRLKDGDIEYVGRADRQVKIRGMRVEPAGIEQHIKDMDGVGDVGVIPYPLDDGTLQLCAYVQTDEDGPTPDDIINHLRGHLPPFSVPTSVVVLDALPRTGSGKISPNLLPDPPLTHPAASETPDGASDAPDPTVTTVAGIWSKALSPHRMGPDDDFFAHGGHSLAAAKALGRIRDRFGIDLPLSAVYDHPTPRQFSTLLTDLPAPDLPWTILPLQPDGALPPLFCMHIVSGLAYSYEPLAAAMGGDHPVYGVVSGPIRGGDPTPRTIEAMARRYADDILAVYPSGPFRVAGYSWAGRLALTTAAVLEDRGHSVDLVAIFDSWHPDDEPEHAYTRMVDNAPNSRAKRGTVRSLVMRMPRIPKRLWYHAVVAWCRVRRSPLPAWAAARLQTRIGMNALKTDHGRFPTCGILYFRAVADDGSASDIRWREWATDARSEIFDVEGTHRGEDSIMSTGRVNQIAAKLNTELNRLDSGT